MTEYMLNHLTRRQLADLAFASAAFLAEITRPAVKIELYYFEGHFIEVSYHKKTLSDNDVYAGVYLVNHFPNTPENTHYLSIYLPQIKLPIGPV